MCSIYIHRGYEFDFINCAMPSLSRDQYDAVVEYVDAHRDELVERDDRIEDLHKRGVDAQRARGGIFADREDLTGEERIARLKEKVAGRMAEKNGARQRRSFGCDCKSPSGAK
jgi:hypothetical protein